jgi:hypothetical protein
MGKIGYCILKEEGILGGADKSLARSTEQLLEFFRCDPNDFHVAIGDHGRNLVISL